MGRIHQHKDKCHGEARRGAGRGRFGPNFAADMGGELGHGFGHGRRGRGGRARRGDIRAAVLDVLGQGPLNGYQLIQTIAERTEGAWKPSPGSVYPTISQLKDEGLIASTRDGSSRMISLTEQGQAWVEANPETMAAVWTSFKEEADEGRDIRSAMRSLMMAATQVFSTGTPAQQQQALKELKETRRKLYLILAEEDEG